MSPAADLRTHLDVLLAEHVMIVAKESAAAFNHSDEYAPYTALLAANSSDLAQIMGRAFGTTTAAQFVQVWDMQNGYLVDYGIGVVTHDDGKANAALAGLNTIVLKLEAALPVDQPYKVWLPLDEQISEDKTFIDNLFAQRYASFYAELHTAYAHTQVIGDALAFEVVNQFPDKFPGRIDGRDVISRVTVNLSLQEHSYLETMATDATVAKRDAEKTAATSALAESASKLGITWPAWDSAVLSYATGATLHAAQFVDRLATGAPKPAVQHYVEATIKVVDDQKSTSSKTLADDDRAAATAIQPIADSI